MTTRVVELANFTGGEYNLRGEVHAPQGSFTASNMVRLIDGSLCPRSGLVDLAPTSNVTGTVLGFGYHAGQEKAWFVIANHVYQFAISPVGSATVTFTNTLAGTPVNRIRSAQNTHSNSTWVAILQDRVYDFNHATATINALAGSPAGRVAEVYGDHLLAGGTVANPERLYFSAAADFNTWPAANYLDVGYGFLIELLSAFRQGVMIGKQDQTWWLLSGTPGVNDVLRLLHRTIGPSDTSGAGLNRWGRSGDGRVWFVPLYGEYPAAASGSSIQPLEYLSFTDAGDIDYPDATLKPAVGVTGLTLPEDVLISTGGVGGGSAALDNQAFLFARGAWSKHAFAKNISGFVDGRLSITRTAYFCDGGGASAQPKFYRWSYDLNRPPFSGRERESKTDAGTAFNSTVTLPVFWVGEPGPVTLKAITVEYKAWNCGFSGNDTFTLAATPILRDGSDQTTVTADPVSVAEGSQTTSGTIRSTTIDFSTLNAAPANGFRVTASSVVGLSLRRFWLHFETHEAQSDTDSA